MGRVVVSIDAELAWGFHDLEQPPERRIRRARRGWRRLVEWLDAYEIPATWAIVGHLFLEECDGRHASHPAADADWFERDPGGRASENDRWFGPDLIERVQEADVDHEIGCHSFSHALFDPATTDREVVEAELEACRAAAREWGISLESFVFPRNVVGYRDVLAEYDFTCYRGVEPSRWYDGSWWYPVGKFASYSAGKTAPPLVSPTVDEYGLVAVPGSLCLFSFEGLARTVVEPIAGDPVLRKAKLGIDAAAQSDGICHLWLHPNDLTTARNVRRLRRILEYVDEQRRTTDLQVETMAEVATGALEEPAGTELESSEPELEAGLEELEHETDVDTPVAPELQNQ
ncbi:polysaccharide deacetylase family protein [Natronobacterium texcoconense]|uniref:Polysaccharide deacetylase n=1 Tax=Natronobacterium texcoconense TaxID=1095778 RepID=A0A1H1F6Q7_NATTX|nr:polysaccharide deacetylase family protein [Natronobacterium texcoconense]SDQ96703.1 Polysaccharide deacetylase [Natronobacterium texcoconense]